jgi:hypothetical protein
MGQINQPRMNLITPAMREAVRQQIVVNGLRRSDAIATALDLRHAVVVRILERFEAVGALRVMPEHQWADVVVVEPLSLSARFRNLDTPLW